MGVSETALGGNDYEQDSGGSVKPRDMVEVPVGPSGDGGAFSGDGGGGTGLQSGGTDSNGPRDGRGGGDSGRRASADMINPCWLTLAILYVALVTLAIVSSENAWATLGYVVVGLAPLLLIVRFVQRHLRCERVSSTFLFNQFLLSAFPVTFLVVIMELILTVLLAAVLLGSESELWRAYLEQNGGPGTGDGEASGDAGAGTGNTDESTQQQNEALLNAIAAIPLWKLLVLALATALLVAAVVEETAKWLCARRVYAKYESASGSSPSSEEREGGDTSASAAGRASEPLPIYGILSSACVCALGLATVENVAYVLGLSGSGTRGTGTGNRIWFVVLRDALAFPVHVGATFLVALASASVQLDKRLGVSDAGKGRAVLKAWAGAVAFHAWFDGISLVTFVLIERRIIPTFTEPIVVAVQAVSVAALVIFLRARFNALVQREHTLIANEQRQLHYAVEDFNDAEAAV